MSVKLQVLSGSLFLAFVIGFIAMSFPPSAQAVGNMADVTCNPVIPQCGCGQLMVQGKCQPGANKFMCPCQDMTSGFATAGVCMSANVCKAQSTNGGGLGDISQMMQAIQKMMEAMKGGGGGGGGGGSGTGSEGCTTYTQVSTPSSDPCSYYVPGSGSSTSDLLGNLGSSGSAADSLISSLLGSNGNTSGNSAGSIVPGTNNSSGSSAIATTTPTQSLNPGTNAQTSQVVFGSSPGVAGDIQVLTNNRVTVLVSNRDVPNNRQTAGFYGFLSTTGQSPKSIYTNICAARPWGANFLSFIIPSNYLDALCTAGGYAVGIKLAPAVVATPTPTPVPPPAPAAPAYLGPMRADIWASPPSVAIGSRASIFWDSAGVVACAITSSDNGISGSSLKGNASSLPLTKNTTFSINCNNATSTVSNQVVVTVQ